MSDAPRIRIRQAYKVNMGNFETYDVDIELEDSVREGEKVDEAKKRINDKVDEWLWPEVEQAKKLAAEGKKASRRN